MSLRDLPPDLSRQSTVAALADALALDETTFRGFVDPVDPRAVYHVLSIPKRTRGPRGELRIREVWNSEESTLNLFHKTVARKLTAFVSRRPDYPHPAAHGFAKGRGTLANASAHVGADRLVSADIKDFYESIPRGTVEQVLRHIGLQAQPAEFLAAFLTPERTMKAGLHASPLLANLVLTPIDEAFSALAADRGLAYTRYADDLTFSGKDGLPTKDELQTVLARHGFTLNRAKFRESKRGQKHYVTGLAVTDDKRPRVPRKLKKRLLRELHIIESFGLAKHCSWLPGDPGEQHVVNRIEGMVSYIASIEPQRPHPLWQQWNAICDREQVRKTFRARPTQKLRDALWLVDESVVESPDGPCLALICAEPFDADNARAALTTFARQESELPYLAGWKAERLAAGVVHWGDLEEGQRERLVDVMKKQAMRAVVFFEPVGDHYQETYLKLLKKLVTQKMFSADDADVHILIEQNDKVPRQAIEKAVAEAHQALETAGRRRPRTVPAIDVLSKERGDLLPYADALLGVMGRYLRVTKESPSTDIVRFKSLEMAFQLIFDNVRNKVWKGTDGLVPFATKP